MAYEFPVKEVGGCVYGAGGRVLEGGSAEKETSRLFIVAWDDTDSGIRVEAADDWVSKGW